ncbi:DUF4097 family beta strand repeat-containing protein [Streptomyces misionensis]|uniref:DUF4097 family beta strand repeat-containing protein n=1 Tax=Streptomyces misionensis TaxID=67331 RepID=UPI00396BB262
MKIRFRAFLVSGALLLAVAPVLSACDQYDDSDSRSFDVKDKVTGVTVDSAGGDIDVVAGDGDGVQVTENLKYKSGKRPSTEHFVRDGDLHLKVATSCGSSLGSANCTVNYRVEVPRGVSLSLHSGGGTVHLDGVSGGVDASTGGGEVKAEDLAAGHLTASSGGGAINASWSKAPDDVDVNAKGGNVTLHVPDSGYQVSASTTLGSKKVDVKTDSSSERHIKARTFAGDVKVLVAG